jgi:putative sigma-54 modulation protein
MVIRTHAIHFHPKQGLINFIQEHLDKLETFSHALQKGDVYLRVNNEGICNKTVEIALDIPGGRLFVCKKSRTFEAATLGAVHSLKSQLKKLKDKVTRKRHRPLI